MTSKAIAADSPSLSEAEIENNANVTERVKMIWEWLMNHREPVFHDSCLRDHVWFTSASVDPKDANRGFANFEMKVPLALCNGGGTLHGGAVALIFDMCTSMAVNAIAREGFWDTGHVTRTLNCVYMRPAPEGTELTIETEVTHVGKTMAQLKGVIRRKDNGKICYTCEHGKVKVDNFPPLNTPAASSKI